MHSPLQSLVCLPVSVEHPPTFSHRNCSLAALFGYEDRSRLFACTFKCLSSGASTSPSLYLSNRSSGGTSPRSRADSDVTRWRRHPFPARHQHRRSSSPVVADAC
ncbi:hypothetical protein VNO77_42242 [Canavalia gladiata]|uniref:Uncharacterized protein n=1 Tax=Canavalia gladiata TaxID=3824 RepID=A0AAN9K2B0_CANGL